MSAAVGGVLGALAIPAQAGVYLVDDGGSESVIGYSGPSEVVWLNQFTSVLGMEKISEVQIAFGGSFGPPNGHPVTVGLWSDPTNDGNPADALLLTSVAGVIADTATDTFVSFPITPTTIPAGDFFFVGFYASTVGSGGVNFAGALDQSSGSAAQSWAAGDDIGGTLDLNDLGSANEFGLIDSFGFPGNWLIRANGVAASAVPEASESALIALGLSLTVLSRRRRRLKDVA